VRALICGLNDIVHKLRGLGIRLARTGSRAVGSAQVHERNKEERAETPPQAPLSQGFGEMKPRPLECGGRLDCVLRLQRAQTHYVLTQ